MSPEDQDNYCVCLVQREHGGVYTHEVLTVKEAVKHIENFDTEYPDVIIASVSYPLYTQAKEACLELEKDFQQHQADYEKQCRSDAISDHISSKTEGE